MVDELGDNELQKPREDIKTYNRKKTEYLCICFR